jgi:rare lipoprotein A (peptidoglycan hydrolase)
MLAHRGIPRPPAHASELIAAHRTLPVGTMVEVTNVHNGRSVVVRINDRDPFIRGRVIDLTPADARAIGFVRPRAGQVDCAVRRNSPRQPFGPLRCGLAFGRADTGQPSDKKNAVEKSTSECYAP